jgi:hypothetical protein
LRKQQKEGILPDGGNVNKRMRRVLSASGLSVALFSCATLPSAYKGVDAAVKTGAFDAAVGEIAAKQTPPKGKNKPKTLLYPEKNRVLLHLDRGMLEHYAGDYEASYADLSEAEREIEEAYTKSVTQSLASYVANDNAKDYAGEDYEDIYVNIFNALNAYHAGNGQAYALVNDLVAQGGELQVLAEKYAQDDSGKLQDFVQGALKGGGTVLTLGTVEWPKARKITFTDSALARYLDAFFALNDGNKDQARYNLFELQSAYRTPVYAGIDVPAPLAVTGERGSEKGPLLDLPAGEGQLNVLAFAGLSPVKAEKNDAFFFPFLIPLYPALFVPWLHPLASGNLKVPTLVPRPSDIRGIRVSIDDGETVQLELLEDISTVVSDTFNGHLSSVYLKTYARVVAKLAVAAAGGKAAEQKALDKNLPALVALGAGLGVLKAAQAALDATEAADTRSGRYLPGKAYMGALNLRPGTHTVTVEYDVAGKPYRFTKTVMIKAGERVLVEAACLQ